MMNSALDILWLRRPSLNYVCPGVCEAAFSGSGFPIIFLDAFVRLLGPSGLVLGGTGGFMLSWNNYPGALCFSVYKAVDELQPFGEYVLIAECITDNFIDLNTFGPGTYRVTAITPEGESDPSLPFVVGGGAVGTVFLTIDSNPGFGVIMQVGPLDVDGNSSGATTFQREFPNGRTVTLTAPITENMRAFQKWQRNGIDLSTEKIVTFTLTEDTDMTAFYVCTQVGDPVPSNFTLSEPTSLGLFTATPDGVPTFISGIAEASIYDFVYRSGTLSDGTCPGLYTLPAGYLAEYNAAVNSADISASPASGSCQINQQLVQLLVPEGKTTSVLHTAGSLRIRYNGAAGFNVGDSLPLWEVIQRTGLITQPASFRIRSFDPFFGPFLAPPSSLNADDPNCGAFNEVQYPVETDPNKVQWDGSFTQGIGHTRTYSSTEFKDEILDAQFQLITGERIALSDTELGEVVVWGPVTKIQIDAEFSTDIPQTGDGGDVLPPGPLYWVFAICPVANGEQPIWMGVKAIGATPVGSYHRVHSICPGYSPTCMYLEAGD